MANTKLTNVSWNLPSLRFECVALSEWQGSATQSISIRQVQNSIQFNFARAPVSAKSNWRMPKSSRQRNKESDAQLPEIKNVDGSVIVEIEVRQVPGLPDAQVEGA